MLHHTSNEISTKTGSSISLKILLTCNTILNDLKLHVVNSFWTTNLAHQQYFIIIPMKRIGVWEFILSVDWKCEYTLHRCIVNSMFVLKRRICWQNTFQQYKRSALKYSFICRNQQFLYPLTLYLFPPTLFIFYTLRISSLLHHRTLTPGFSFLFPFFHFHYS